MNGRNAGLSPGQRQFPMLPRVLGAQIAAFIVFAFLVWSISGNGIYIQDWFWLFVGLQAIAAGGFSYWFGLKGKWIVAQALLVPLAWGALMFGLPAWVYLLAFVLLALIFTNVSKERVPLYLTNRTTWAALSQHLDTIEVEPGTRPVFMDLGAGLGGMLHYLSRQHPDWDFVGLENAPLPYLTAKLRLLGRGNASIVFKSLWDADLSKVQVAYAFLSPAPMDELLKKVEAEMKPKTQFLSNSFWSQDRAFDQELEVNDGRKTQIFMKYL
ncbi:hypothetical protein V5T82_02915 [Magnetovibrio sp. PR-2]|uniref:hypothetical protein n=1 Tax=Magnetovibrio sp. PR-2 TaxID=3120356 RepID=UPI002FCE1F82